MPITTYEKKNEYRNKNVWPTVIGTKHINLVTKIR